MNRERSLARVGMSVIGVAGVVAAILAAAMIWLVFTEPVTVADAVREQSVSPVVRELADLIYTALRRLLRFI